MGAKPSFPDPAILPMNLTLPRDRGRVVLKALDAKGRHCATDAAIVHFDDVLLCNCAVGLQQRIVNANLTRGAAPQQLGHAPSTAGIFWRKLLKDPGNALTVFLAFHALESMVGIPQPYNARHLKHPEHLHILNASFFRSGSREGLSELVMEFPAVLRVPLLSQFIQN